MRLLICTQKVDSNDSNLGFFHRWIEEFATQCEDVRVVCLVEGAHALPKNVSVYSLGAGSRIGRAVRLLLYVTRMRHQYDAVFVHMNPEYIVACGLLWRLWKKRIALWYAHRSVTLNLRIALWFVNYVFTVSSDSFAILTPKLRVVGHGIDTRLFTPMLRIHDGALRIVTTGRIAESKQLIEMLQVLDVLYSRGKTFIFTIVGEPVSAAERAYAAVLKKEIEARPYASQVRMPGSVAHNELPQLLSTQNVFLNFGMTGNMDKAGLEALSAGIPVVTTNEAFRALLEPYGLYVARGDAPGAADSIGYAASLETETLSQEVRSHHGLQRLVKKILKVLALTS